MKGAPTREQIDKMCSQFTDPTEQAVARAMLTERHVHAAWEPCVGCVRRIARAVKP